MDTATIQAIPQTEPTPKAVTKRLNPNKIVGWGIFVAFLIWLFAPLVKMNIEWDRELRSKQRMRDLVNAQLEFQRDHGHLPNNQNGLSWRVHLLPYLGERRLYEKFNLAEPWDSPHNIKLLKKRPQIFLSEGINGKVDSSKTLFLRPIGNGSFPIPGSPEDEAFSTNQIKKHLFDTVFLVEIDPDQAVYWTKPQDHEFDPNQPKNNLGKARRGDSAFLCRGNAIVWDISYVNENEELRENFTLVRKEQDLAAHPKN